MKRIIILGIFSFCLINSLAVLAGNQDDSAKIREIHQQTQQLQGEIDRLRVELESLKYKKSRPQYKNHVCYPRKVCNQGNICSSCPHPGPSGAPGSAFSTNETQTETGLPSSGEDILKIPNLSPRYQSFLAIIGSTVTTSPFLGLRSAFDASDLIINLPTMNEDLRFLKEHVELDKRLCALGITLPDRPLIELGGKIEGIVSGQEGFNNWGLTNDIDLASARLDVLVEVSRAVRAFMAFNMDTSTAAVIASTNLSVELAGGSSRIQNSRVFISRAFVTIGDLNRFPIYFTIGQMFVPFGRYASNMITSPLTLQLARTNERAALLGIYEHGVYGSVYAFKGDIDLSSSGINTWGTNWGYEYKWKDSSLNVGVGYISNIADSTGMQITGASSGFFGFGLDADTEILRHRVPAMDVHGEFALGKFGIFAEYVWTTRSFDVCNLSFDGAGARPSALNLEGSYTFKIADCPASLAVGIGASDQALALTLPQRSFLTTFNISIWKNTIESFEYRHDTNYPTSDFAGGNGAIPLVINSEGGSRNSYTAQIGVYF